MALEEMTNGTGEGSLRAFLTEHIAPSYLSSAGEKELLELLQLLRERCGNAGGIGIQPVSPNHVTMEFESRSGFWDVQVHFASGPACKIERLEIEQGAPQESIEPMTWDTYEERLLEYEREGFCGSVLVAKNGVVIHDRGYGAANAKLGAPNKADTVFAIGSTPIDFTKAALLILEDRGKLKTSDLMSKYLSGVPKDKAGITLDHLMDGESGLRNFHGNRGVDADLDLSYIDRAEALRRIFESTLLFEPGTQFAHSHSAWGVLAAIVEEASGQSYGDFIEEHIFAPVGMQRTGLYPDSRAFPDAEVAMGEVRQPFGKESTPKNWGETSWLVMGSGGMVSTTGDLYALMAAVREGKLLSEASEEKYWVGGVLAGGNDRGFLTMYTEGVGPRGASGQLVLCSNSHVGSGDLASQVAEALAEMVMAGSAPPFAIGLAAEVSPAGVELVAIVPDSAAAAAGLQVGDFILSVNKQEAQAHFEELLIDAAQTGAALTLKIERDGKSHTLVVTPKKRS